MTGSNAVFGIAGIDPARQLKDLTGFCLISPTGRHFDRTAFVLDCCRGIGFEVVDPTVGLLLALVGPDYCQIFPYRDP